MTYGPEASHFTGQMPRSLERGLFVQDAPDSASEFFDSGKPTAKHKSRRPAWWPLVRAHWPR